MRLLKLDDNFGLSLITFPETKLPSYAILSHTWGRDGTEITYRDIIQGKGNDKAGYRKLEFCANQAKAEGLHYIWIDTCCIDKSNSSEVQKAINSMFRWYQNAKVCYVYLSDVSVYTQDRQFKHLAWKSTFNRSRWFTRGWTLQELLAPKIAEFYSSDGIRLGDKKSLEREIHNITGIALEALRGHSLAQFSVDERLRWGYNRKTTEKEDKAYCLLGIFKIHLPLIYGEGEANAMKRLLKEIKESKTADSKVSGMITATSYISQVQIDETR
jgi:hypothetical protein